ncbi:MAG TPA: hypothetical protein VHK69_20790 [Chitinophagaceae bacterium]|jgi:hypothetical protein|nr:hypothetical protein [Chitinophagaceae bacterium]
MNRKQTWLIGLGALVAAAAAWLLIRNANEGGTEKPPKNAPQLDLENPGSQDDFPKPPATEGAAGIG